MRKVFLVFVCFFQLLFYSLKIAIKLP